MRRARAHKFWDDSGGGCLLVAGALQEVLEKMGYRASIEAGSMSWPIVRPEDDDGVSATHFGYEWSPHEVPSQIAAALDCMPEMHVWVIILAEIPVLVDATTKFFPEQCQKLTGLPWRHDPPPEYLWVPVDDAPQGVRYVASIAATFLAEKKLAELRELDQSGHSR
jgi:hypothetical protein